MGIVQVFVELWLNEVCDTETFAPKPIGLQILYNRSFLAYAFLVVHSPVLGSSKSQGVASSWVCFGLVIVDVESGGSGDCMIVVGSLIDPSRYPMALQTSAATMIRFLNVIQFNLSNLSFSVNVGSP